MGNAFNNIERAFSSDILDELLDAGGDAVHAIGNDAAASFNLGMALSGWKDSLNAGARNHIIIDGDSNAAYSDASPFKWAQQLRGDLITLTGLADGGPGFVRADGFAQISGVNSTNDNSLIDSYRRGPHGAVRAMSGAGTPTFEWTRPANFGPHDRFALYAWDDDFLAGQGEYSLDGGAWTGTAFNYAGPVGFVNQEIVGTVTSTLGVRTTGGFWAFEGAALYQGTTGLVVHNVANGGIGIENIAGPAGRNVSLWDHLQPALTIFWTGTTELNYIPAQGVSQLPVDDFYDYYTAAVSKARQYGDVLIVFPQATTIPNTIAEPSDIPIKQVEYQKAARLVAWEQDAGFLSIAQVFGSPQRAIARDYMATGGLDPHHLSEAGHEAVHRIIKRAIERNS